MRILTNEPLIKKRSATAQRAMTVGIALLVLSVILSFRRQAILPAYGVMILGIVLVNWGVSYGGKWLRNPRADHLLAKALKSFDGGSRLYNYLLPVDHVVLSPAGLFVLKVKEQDGRISCQGEKWQRRQSWRNWLRSIFEPRLGNPSRQARSEVDKLQRWLTAHMPDTKLPVQPVIVFVDPQAELHVVDPTVPALALGDLKTYMRDATKVRIAPQEVLKALANLFDEQAA